MSENEKKLTDEAFIVEKGIKGINFYRDYTKENLETTKLKRLVRNS